MLAAVVAFSVMDSLVKGLSSRYGTFQVASMRGFSSLVCIGAVVMFRGSWSKLRPVRVHWHLMRGCLGTVMMASFIYAVHRLSLAQTYSLFHTAPLVMTALSVPIFKEKVTPSRWFAILVGLCGVLIILKPWESGSLPLLAAGAAVLATFGYAISALTVRSLTRDNSSLAITFWYLTIIGVGCGILGASQWIALLHTDWWWLAGVGISGALGQIWITSAFSCAPPSVVAPFEYTSILWAFGIDWVFWSASPTVHLLIGATIVVGSGVYVVMEEHRLPASTPP